MSIRCRCMGLSAHAIIHGGNNHPWDPDDLSRCLAVSPMPPLHMRDRSPEWALFVDHWQELAALFADERPTGKAPKTYKLMKEIRRKGDEIRRGAAAAAEGNPGSLARELEPKPIVSPANHRTEGQ